MKRDCTLLLCEMVFTAVLAGGLAGTTSSTEDPKCSFLRRELVRLQGSPVPVPERIPSGVRPLFGRHITEVNVDVVQGKISSCEKKEKLSSLSRLRALESARLQHVDKIRKEVDPGVADVLVEAVNSQYEQEARSFYNYETVRVPVLDRDVVKDFPTLLELVKGSILPQELKTSFVQNFKYIKYEEAGSLQSGLRGVDKNLGTTFAFVLRSDLSDRAATDGEQRKAAEEASTKALADSVRRQKIQARITVSLSALAVLALVGFLLIRRELVDWPIWLNVLAVAGLVLLGWILVGMGFLTWLMSYMDLAF